MWESIVSGLVKALGALFIDWWKEERAVSDSYEARARKEQLDSMREGRETENRIKREVDAVHTIGSPADWRNRVLLLALLLPLVGCFRFHVYHAAYRPIPPAIEAVEPSSPTEADLVKQLEACRAGQEVPFSSREVSIFTYAAKLERAYNLIRQDAIQANQESGYPTIE